MININLQLLHTEIFSKRRKICTLLSKSFDKLKVFVQLTPTIRRSFNPLITCFSSLLLNKILILQKVFKIKVKAFYFKNDLFDPKIFFFSILIVGLQKRATKRTYQKRPLVLKLRKP